MPSARASSRGLALNWRLAVNGIQKASSSSRAGAGVIRAFMRVLDFGAVGFSGWLLDDKEIQHIPQF
jgi:hypothetical protein